MLARLLLLLILLAASLAAGSAQAAEIRRVSLQLCQTEGGGRVCREIVSPYLNLNGRDAELVQVVDIPPDALGQPLTVAVTAMAASEVRWDGVLIGANGRPANDRAHEVPGRLESVISVPAGLAHAGLNTVTARVSSRWLFLPVRAPLHLFEVGPYQDPMRLGLVRYLPALGMAGVLGLAALYFGVLAVLDRRGGAASAAESPGPGLLAAIAAVALAQLAVETARVFFAYLYPWHLVRVSAIAVLAAATSALIAAWAARRFAPALRWWAPAAVTLAAAPALLFGDGFDGKALIGVALGQGALAVCALMGLKRRPVLAGAALAWAAVAFAFAWRLNAVFLDGAYYLLLAAAFGALVAGQAWSLWRARQAGPAAAPEPAGPEALVIKDGARTHRAPLTEIRYLKAADDYCEVSLEGGRSLLAASTLTRLAAALPPRFVRIHRSYVVDGARVRTLATRPGGGRAVVLDDGETLPVGRAYGAALRDGLMPAGGGG